MIFSQFQTKIVLVCVVIGVLSIIKNIVPVVGVKSVAYFLIIWFLLKCLSYSDSVNNVINVGAFTKCLLNKRQYSLSDLALM